MGYILLVTLCVGLVIGIIVHDKKDVQELTDKMFHDEIYGDKEK